MKLPKNILYQIFRNTSIHLRNTSKQASHRAHYGQTTAIAKFEQGHGMRPPFSRAFNTAVEATDIYTRERCKYVKSNPGRRTVDIEWSDGKVASFPYVFLRDNCTCPQCFDPSSGHRLLMLKDLNLKCEPSSLEISDCEAVVQVTWEDGHKSSYPSKWLRNHEFSQENRTRRTKLLGIRPVHNLWGSEMQNTIPTFDFVQLMEDNRTLYRWIHSLLKFGLALIQNAPHKPGQLTRIGQRVPFLKKTNYGILYDVVLRSNPSNAAYTDAQLPCHNDQPYTEYSPGMQMLHCIEQNVTGGENILVDGFFAAEKLKEANPRAYDFLTTVEIDHEDVGHDVYPCNMMTRKHLIELDYAGKVKRVGFSNFARATRQHLPIGMIESMYRALKAFDDVICDPGTHITHKLKQGEIVCMNNQRIMHGRKSFKLDKGKGRHLEGAYIDWDQLMTKFRLLGTDIEDALDILD